MAKRRTIPATRTKPKARNNKRPMVIGAVLAVVAVVAALAIWAANGNTDSTPQAGEQARIEHIHGLGIDPADGTLYAAAHNGVFQVATGGTATRAGTGQQDTMGFTIAGPKHFLGSGHPAPGQGGPNHLGLIESKDAAATWQTRSQAGTADFHALRYAHNTVYGYNSTNSQLIVSTDMTTWQTRTNPGLRDFVVSPTDPNQLLATTAQGLSRSTDQGRTWTPAGGPPLALLDWQQAGQLWGITTGGEIFTSSDSGQNWTRTGAAQGQPTALTTNGDTVYLALHTGAIVQSTDKGATWTIRYQ